MEKREEKRGEMKKIENFLPVRNEISEHYQISEKSEVLNFGKDLI